MVTVCCDAEIPIWGNGAMEFAIKTKCRCLQAVLEINNNNNNNEITGTGNVVN